MFNFLALVDKVWLRSQYLLTTVVIVANVFTESVDFISWHMLETCPVLFSIVSGEIFSVLGAAAWAVLHKTPERSLVRFQVTANVVSTERCSECSTFSL